MSSIFLSHSSRNDEDAKRVKQFLKDQEYKSVFLDFDPEDGIPPGRNWEKEIYSKLRKCRALIVLCSRHSMVSPWCFSEITHARAFGKSLFPVKIDDCEVHTLLQDTQIIDIPKIGWKEALLRLGRGLLEAGLDPKDVEWDPERPPYPGLLAFEKEDAAVFFGRDAEIDRGRDVLYQLRRFGGARLVMVLGASGSGKSSLVRAGILPRLEKDRRSWLVVPPFRPKKRPFDELSKALADSFTQLDEARDWQPIAERFRQHDYRDALRVCDGQAKDLHAVAGSRESTVLFAIDQFEELFGDTEDDEGHRFLFFLRDLLSAEEIPVMVLATLRSDSLGTFQQHPALLDVPFEDVKVGPMSVGGMAQVIQGPADVAGIELKPGLVEQMVDDTQSSDALPLLAFTLRKLREEYGKDDVLEVSNYEDLGGLEGAIKEAAEGVLRAYVQKRRAGTIDGEAVRLSEEVRRDLRKAFRKMVDVNEEGQYVRRQARWADMPAGIHDLLETFQKARLLISDEGAQQERVLEVAHEALFRVWPRLKDWLDQNHDFLVWRKRMQAARLEWEEDKREPEALLQGRRFEEAQRWLSERREELDDATEAFIRQSVDRDFLLWRKRLRAALQEWKDSGQKRELLLRRESLVEAQRRRRERSADLSEEERDFIRQSRLNKTRGPLQMAAGLVLVLSLGVGAWLLYSRSSSYQIDRIRSEAPGLLADAQEETITHWRQALSLLKETDEALAVAEKIENPSERAKALGEVAALLVEVESAQDADAVLDSALIVKIEDPSDRAKALRVVAPVLVEVGRAQDADSVLKEALTFVEMNPFDRALSEVAITLIVVGKTDEAFAVAEKIDDPYDRFGALRDVASYLVEAGKMDEALAFLEKIDDPYDRFGALRDVASYLVEAGRTQDASTALNEALAAAEKIKDPSKRVDALRDVASALVKVGRAQDTDSALNEVLAAAEKSEDPQWRVYALRDVAVALAGAGKAVEALDVVEKIDPGDRGNVLELVATALVEAGKIDEALAVVKKLQDSPARAWALLDFATALIKAGRTQDAGTVLNEALADAVTIESPSWRAEFHLDVATALVKAEKLDVALAGARKISDLFERAGFFSDVALALVEAGRMQDADTMLDSALAVAKNLKDPSEQAWALHGVARDLAFVEKIDEALAVAEKIDDPSERAKALHGVAIALVQAGRMSEAGRVLNEALAPAKDLSSATEKSDIYTRSAKIQARLHRYYHARKNAEEEVNSSDARLGAYTVIVFEHWKERHPELAERLRERQSEIFKSLEALATQ